MCVVVLLSLPHDVILWKMEVVVGERARNPIIIENVE